MTDFSGNEDFLIKESRLPIFLTPEPEEYQAEELNKQWKRYNKKNNGVVEYPKWFKKIKNRTNQMQELSSSRLGKDPEGAEASSRVRFEAVEDHPTQSKIVKINIKNPEKLREYNPQEEPENYVTLGELITVEKTFGPGGRWFFDATRTSKSLPYQTRLNYVTLDFDEGYTTVANITPATNTDQLLKNN